MVVKVGGRVRQTQGKKGLCVGPSVRYNPYHARCIFTIKCKLFIVAPNPIWFLSTPAILCWPALLLLYGMLSLACSFLPWGLCTCCSFFLEDSSSKWLALSSFRSHFRKNFLSSSVSGSPGPVTFSTTCCCYSALSRVWLFAIVGSVARQAPLSMGFHRQEYWSGLPFPFPGDLPDPRIEPISPALADGFLPTESLTLCGVTWFSLCPLSFLPLCLFLFLHSTLPTLSRLFKCLFIGCLLPWKACSMRREDLYFLWCWEQHLAHQGGLIFLKYWARYYRNISLHIFKPSNWYK